MIGITYEKTLVPTSVGDLNAIVHVPDLPGPLPGMVLVDGSGDGAADDWGGWPERLTACGAVVLTHDKPGSGTSPGDWREQDFEDRARESLSAIEVLRKHPSVGGLPVGLFGVSQGGWVSLLAASIDPDAVGFVVSMSGPGVSPAVQDRVRIERDLHSEGFSDAHVAEALAWIDERAERLLAGEDAAAVLERQNSLSGKSWHAVATRYFGDAEVLAFIGRILDFEPMAVLDRVRAPVLALFGGADELVPVPESVAAFAAHLPVLPGDPHGLAVFPRANHGLFIADPEPGVDRTSQLAPGFLPMVAGFLAARNRGTLASS